MTGGTLVGVRARTHGRPAPRAARTPLGRKLMRLREKAIAGGMRVLSEDEVLDLVSRRRGEPRTDETNSDVR